MGSNPNPNNSMFKSQRGFMSAVFFSGDYDCAPGASLNLKEHNICIANKGSRFVNLAPYMSDETQINIQVAVKIDGAAFAISKWIDKGSIANPCEYVLSYTEEVSEKAEKIVLITLTKTKI